MPEDPSGMNWTARKGLYIFLLFISAPIVDYFLPAHVEGVAVWLDQPVLLFLFAAAFLLSLYHFFYYNSPHIFTESEKVNTNANDVYRVTPDDERLPLMLMMPFGGYNAVMAKDDMGLGGGVLFAPHYLVELLGQYLIVHGKPLALSDGAIKSNKWMVKALEQFEEYMPGQTSVWFVAWGAGPAFDAEPDPREVYRASAVQHSFKDAAQDVRKIFKKAEGDFFDTAKAAERLYQKPIAERVLLKEKELADKSKGED